MQRYAPPDPNAPAVNPLPPVVWALTVPMFMIELMFLAGAQGFIGGADAVGWRLGAIQDWGFLGLMVDWMLENGTYPPDQLARFVTYSFIHLSFTHMIFACVFILALGKMVGEVFPAWAVLVVFFGAAIVGALAYWALSDGRVPLVGGFPGAYGLIGAFTFLLWRRLRASGDNPARAFALIGFLLFFQLAFGLAFGAGQDWIAELAGFATGFAVSPLVRPGGWAQILERLRQR